MELLAFITQFIIIAMKINISSATVQKKLLSIFTAPENLELMFLSSILKTEKSYWIGNLRLLFYSLKVLAANNVFEITIKQ